jgi:hypothetical protein
MYADNPSEDVAAAAGEDCSLGGSCKKKNTVANG